jgi:hypothetical protein
MVASVESGRLKIPLTPGHLKFIKHFVWQSQAADAGSAERKAKGRLAFMNVSLNQALRQKNGWS